MPPSSFSSSSLYFILSPRHSLCLSLSLTHFYSFPSEYVLSLCLPLSFSLTHSLTPTHTHTLSLSLSLSRTHPLSHILSLRYSPSVFPLQITTTTLSLSLISHPNFSLCLFSSNLSLIPVSPHLFFLIPPPVFPRVIAIRFFLPFHLSPPKTYVFSFPHR